MPVSLEARESLTPLFNQSNGGKTRERWRVRGAYSRRLQSEWSWVLQSKHSDELGDTSLFGITESGFLETIEQRSHGKKVKEADVLGQEVCQVMCVLDHDDPSLGNNGLSKLS